MVKGEFNKWGTTYDQVGSDDVVRSTVIYPFHVNHASKVPYPLTLSVDIHIAHLSALFEHLDLFGRASHFHLNRSIYYTKHWFHKRKSRRTKKKNERNDIYMGRKNLKKESRRSW